MLKVNTKNLRGRFCLTASVLAVAAAFAVPAANAQTVTVAANQQYSMWSGVTTYLVPNGVTAELWNYDPTLASPPMAAWPGTAGNPVLYTMTLGTANNTWVDSNGGAAHIAVASGGTLVFQNWYWGVSANMINASAGSNLVVNPMGLTILMGSNTILGNVTVNAGNQLAFGQNWSIATPTFGSTTTFTVGSGSSVDFYNSSASSNVIDTFRSTGGATVNLWGGTIAANGINTAAIPYIGTISVNTGGNLVVGDASHPTAVLGDPTGNGLTINVTDVGGSLGVLSGYGTVYGAVNNGGIVRPGGTSGTPGTLTVSSYTQTSTGILQVEVTPTTASKLKVNGAASVAGSLIINVDAGTYGNSVYNILSASSITGNFSSITTSGSVGGAIVGLQISSTAYNLVTEKASGAQAIGHLVTANRSSLNDFTRSLYDVIEFGSPSTGVKAAAGGGEVRAWAAPYLRRENVGRDGLGYDLTSIGLTGGVEYRAPANDAVIGLAASYDNGSMDVKNETTKAQSHTYDVAVYGGADVQNARLDGVIFYNTYNAASKRDLSTYGTAKGTEKAWSWGASAQLSRSLFNDLVTPYIRGIYAKIHQDGVTEHGTTLLDLNYDEINSNTFVGDIGLRVHVLHPTPELKIKADVTLAVQHDFSDLGEKVVGRFANLGGSDFTYTWKGNPGNTALVGVNVSGQVAEGVELFGRLNGAFTQYMRAGELQVGARYRF